MAVGSYMHDPSTESAAWIWAHPVHDSNARSFAVSSGRARASQEMPPFAG
jgi:hypothetical protein